MLNINYSNFIDIQILFEQIDNLMWRENYKRTFQMIEEYAFTYGGNDIKLRDSIRAEATIKLINVAREMYIYEKDGLIYADNKRDFRQYLYICRRAAFMCSDMPIQNALREAIYLSKKEFYNRKLGLVAKFLKWFALTIFFTGFLVPFRGNPSNVRILAFVFRQLPLTLFIIYFIASYIGSYPRWQLNKLCVIPPLPFTQRVLLRIIYCIDLIKALPSNLVNIIVYLIKKMIMLIIKMIPIALLIFIIYLLRNEIRDLFIIFIICAIIYEIGSVLTSPIFLLFLLFRRK